MKSKQWPNSTQLKNLPSEDTFTVCV